MDKDRDRQSIERQMTHVLEACRAALEPLSRQIGFERAEDLVLKLQGRASVVMQAVNGGPIGEAAQFEEMAAGIEGWSEWRRPMPGYRIACCDCGLVHEMEFRIVKDAIKLPDGSLDAWNVQDPNLGVIFRARRSE